ncbi:MAG: hypothetical protein Q8Q36_01895 [bacterium]|nr:hypothetical protein [bacterium]
MGTTVIAEGKLEPAKAGEKYDIRSTGTKRAAFCREGATPAEGVIHFGEGEEALLTLSSVPRAARHEFMIGENEPAELHKSAEGRWQLHFVERRNTKVSLYRLADMGIKAELASPALRSFVRARKDEGKREKALAGRSARRALRKRTSEKNKSPA